MYEYFKSNITFDSLMRLGFSGMAAPFTRRLFQRRTDEGLDCTTLSILRIDNVQHSAHTIKTLTQAHPWYHSLYVVQVIVCVCQQVLDRPH